MTAKTASSNQNCIEVNYEVRDAWWTLSEASCGYARKNAVAGNGAAN